MMENRIPSLKCDSDVFVTFEGDNMVMLQVKSCQTPPLKADEAFNRHTNLQKVQKHMAFLNNQWLRDKKREAYITRLAWQTHFCLRLFFVFCLILARVQQHAVVAHDVFEANEKSKTENPKRLLPRRIELFIITGGDEARRKLDVSVRH